MIAGLQKMTLLDFPGKVACTVFLQGCNFRCPFCHNSDLLGKEGPEGMSVEGLLEFLKKRQGLLDGVCITGGEPTLQPGLEELLIKIRALGFAIKLDTNGGRPEVLMDLAQKGLIDYVAMDIKNCPELYGKTAGVPAMGLDRIEKSVRFLLMGELDYEFRTTVVAELHDGASIENIGLWLTKLSPEKKAKRFFLQSYVDRDSVLESGLHAPEKVDMECYAEILAPYVESVQVRGVD